MPSKRPRDDEDGGSRGLATKRRRYTAVLQMRPSKPSASSPTIIQAVEVTVEPDFDVAMVDRGEHDAHQAASNCNRAMVFHVFPGGGPGSASTTIRRDAIVDYGGQKPQWEWFIGEGAGTDVVDGGLETNALPEDEEGEGEEEEARGGVQARGGGGGGGGGGGSGRGEEEENNHNNGMEDEEHHDQEPHDQDRHNDDHHNEDHHNEDHHNKDDDDDGNDADGRTAERGPHADIPGVGVL
ncbi:hypothetical protein GGR56DRAFT_683932 [Xylariaceae sp. FL0804]|nr:hypothetical protein GGR56DRAFT_683932 [Xylariaceae sp. FL0804]